MRVHRTPQAATHRMGSARAACRRLNRAPRPRPRLSVPEAAGEGIQVLRPSLLLVIQRFLNRVNTPLVHMKRVSLNKILRSQISAGRGQIGHRQESESRVRQRRDASSNGAIELPYACIDGFTSTNATNLARRPHRLHKNATAHMGGQPIDIVAGRSIDGRLFIRVVTRFGRSINASVLSRVNLAANEQRDCALVDERSVSLGASALRRRMTAMREMPRLQ